MGRSADVRSRRSLATTTSTACAVDYFALPRKRLQQLCKKHGIPANKTNIFMAEALSALLKVGEQSIEELQSCAESGAQTGIVEGCTEPAIYVALGNAAGSVQNVTDTDMTEVSQNFNRRSGDTIGSQMGGTKCMISGTQIIPEEDVQSEVGISPKAPKSEAMEAERTSSCLEDNRETHDMIEISDINEGASNGELNSSAPNNDIERGQSHHVGLPHRQDDTASLDLIEFYGKADRETDGFKVAEDTGMSDTELISSAPISVRFGSNNITAPLKVDSADPFAKNWLISGNFNLLFGGQKHEPIMPSNKYMSASDSKEPGSTKIVSKNSAGFPCSEVDRIVTVKSATQETNMDLALSKVVRCSRIESRDKVFRSLIPELQFCISTGLFGPAAMIHNIKMMRRFTPFSQLVKERFSRMSFHVMFSSGRLRLAIPNLLNKSTTTSGVVDFQSFSNSLQGGGLLGSDCKVEISQNITSTTSEVSHCSAVLSSSRNSEISIVSFLPTGESFLPSTSALSLSHKEVVPFLADRTEQESQPASPEWMDASEQTELPKSRTETHAVSLLMECEVAVEIDWKRSTEPAGMCLSDASSLQFETGTRDSMMESDAEFSVKKDNEEETVASAEAIVSSVHKDVRNDLHEEDTERIANEGLIEQLTLEYEKERLERRKRLVSCYLEQFKKTPFVRKSRVNRDVAKAMSIGSAKRAKIIAERRATPVAKKHVAITMRPLSFADGDCGHSGSTIIHGGSGFINPDRLPDCGTASKGETPVIDTIECNTGSPRSNNCQLETAETAYAGVSDMLDGESESNPVGRAEESLDNLSNRHQTSLLEDIDQNIASKPEVSEVAEIANTPQNGDLLEGACDMLTGLNVVVEENGVGPIAVPDREQVELQSSSHAETDTGFLSELLQTVTVGPVKHKLKSKQMKHREQFKHLPAFGRRRFLEKTLIDVAKRRSAKRAAAIHKRRLAVAAQCNADEQPAAKSEKGDKLADNAPFFNVPLATLLEETSNPASQLQGKAAEKQRKHQQQYKTPLKGRSKDKAVKSASKFAAFQRTMLLRERRGLIDDCSAYIDSDIEMVNRESPLKENLPIPLTENRPSPLNEDRTRPLKRRNSSPLKENCSSPLNQLPSPLPLKKNSSSLLTELPSPLNNHKSPLKDISNSA